MKKKGQISIGGIVIMLIAIITALVLIQAIFSSQTQLTTKTNTINETVSLTDVRKGDTKGSINTSYWVALTNGCPQTNNNWRLTDTSDCALSGITVQLNNGTALVLNTDYVVNTTGGIGKASCTTGAVWGDIAYKNTSATFGSADNVTKVSYTFCQDGYSTNSASRTMAGLIGLLAVVALAIVVLYLGMKEWL